MRCSFGKKFTALFMAAVVSTSLVPLPAFAADDSAFYAATGSMGQVSVQAETSTQSLALQATKLSENQTALGLFKYIRDNSTKGTAAYVDAQCAIDILTGKTTKGVSYPSDQGPAQDGWTEAMNGASNKNAYKKVDLTNENDAASLANFEKSLDFIDEYNKYRAKENKAEGMKLTTNVGMNCRMMAISIVQCDWSKATVTHSRAYNIGENLAWGYASGSPFSGWYTAEKKNYKTKGAKANASDVGHYLNIVDRYGATTATGFAVNANGAAYGICHEQTFFTNGKPNITYTTSQFRAKWLDKYKKGAIAAEKKINPMRVTVKKNTVTLKAKNLKKKAKQLANVKVSKAQGKVTYKNVSKGKKAKRFKVTKKGKVKVTKGLKKGKYKVIVQVTAAGNDSCRPSSKKVVFIVKVKASPNTLVAKARKELVNLNESALSAKAVKVANVKVRKAQGKVTYKNVSKDKRAKKFKVTRKGEVKVAKGLKKGKYKVIVQVKASGDSWYKPVKKKVKFIVRVNADKSKAVDADANFIGKWTLVRMMDGGEETGASDLELLRGLGLEVILVLDANGSCTLDLFGDAQKGIWEADSPQSGRMILEGQTIDLTLANGELTIGQEGATLTFAKA